MTSPSGDTEPDSATWTFWPNAPTRDFARLIPCSPEAKTAFRRQVQRILDGSLPSYSTAFIHYEWAESHVVEPISDNSTNEDGPVRSSSETKLPSVTGFFRFNMHEPAPANHGLGWIVGSGRKGVNVELLLSERGLHSRHLRVRRQFDTGSLVAISDGREFWVDKYHLRRVRDEEDQSQASYQRTLGQGAILSIGALKYSVELVHLSRNIHLAQISDARQQDGAAIDTAAFLLTPTPSESTRIGEFEISAPIAKGAYAIVHFAVSNVTGEKFAIKRITDRINRQSEISNEIKMLKLCHHAHIASLERELSHTFQPTNRRQQIDVFETCLVLKPAVDNTVSDFIQQRAPLPSHRRTKFLRALFSQIGSACEYLHDQLHAMHRDIKPENIGVVSTHTEDGQKLHFCLLDFGHAFVGTRSRDHMKGTERYLAPEVMELKLQPMAQQSYTNAVDVWSFGLVGVEVYKQRRLTDHLTALDAADDIADESKSFSATTTAGSLVILLDSMLQRSVHHRISMREVVCSAFARSEDNVDDRRTQGQ